MGMVGVDEFQKRFEATMGKVIPITHASGGCMGQQNIHTAYGFNGPFQFTDPFLHLLFCEHVLALAVASATTQTQNTNTFIDN